MKQGAYSPEEYIKDMQKKCFICDIINHGPKRAEHHIFYEDAEAIGFLDKYPTTSGQAIIAPKKHKVHFERDFTSDEYLYIQKIILKAAKAIQKILEAERMYLLSIGSDQLVAHIHFRLFPLPKGIPYDKQQFVAMEPKINPIIILSKKESELLASKIRKEMSK